MKYVSDSVRNVFLGVVLSLIWMRFLIRLIERWNLLKPDVRETLGMFMVLYCVLCFNIAFDKSRFGYISLLLATVLLASAYRIVWMLL